ncbi:MAG TPA: hypothetical protein VFS00_27375 [Polyangiaceae bacterium]|nr:hypothetical protein [Polyangiaceae bacterium]
MAFAAAATYACAASAPGDEGRAAADEGARATLAAGTRPRLHRGVGALIEAEAARRWVDAYVARHPGELRSIYFGRDAFEAAVRRPGAEGVSMRLAINDEGNVTFALVPLDHDGKRLPAAEVSTGGGSFFVVDSGLICPPSCPSDENARARLHRGVGAPIASEAAQRWVDAYRTRHPTGLHSVFYGRDVLEALLDRPGCEGVSIERALDDEGREALVLLPRGRDGGALPRDAAGGGRGEGEAGAPYTVDSGVTCPPTCPSDEG